MIIYKATNKVNGKIYIGQTVQPLVRRWSDHCRHDPSRNHQSYLHRAIAKYGAEFFIVEQIDSASTLEGLNALEEHYITKFNCLAPNGYNLKRGGKNFEMHPDVRAKISAKLSGRPIPNRWDKGRSKPHSEETKAKLSAALKGRPFLNRYTGGNKKPRTEEQKAHLSKMIKGKPNVVLYKPVECSNGMTFDSINDAAKHFNVVRQTIASLIKTGTTGRLGHTFTLKK